MARSIRKESQSADQSSIEVSSIHCRIDCKTVRIFAYSSKREQSNKRSGTRLKTESETGERRYGFFPLASHALRACEARALRARKTRTPRFTDFFTDFEKKNDCFAVYVHIIKKVIIKWIHQKTVVEKCIIQSATKHNMTFIFNFISLTQGTNS